MPEYMPCEVAKVELMQVLSDVRPDRVYNMLLWLSNQWAPDGTRVRNEQMHEDLPRHFDCKYFDECGADVAHCRFRKD